MQPMTDAAARAARAVELYAQGMSQRAACRAAGCGEAGFRRAMAEQGVEFRALAPHLHEWSYARAEQARVDRQARIDELRTTLAELHHELFADVREVRIDKDGELQEYTRPYTSADTARIVGAIHRVASLIHEAESAGGNGNPAALGLLRATAEKLGLRDA